MPVEVADGDHRKPPARQSVVGIVPLRALGIHPDPPAGHEIRELGQHRDQQFFREIRPDQLAAAIAEEFAVVSDGIRAGVQLVVP